MTQKKQKRMKAAVLHAPGDIRAEEVDVPAIKDDEVLIRVRACGVCGSDPHRVMVSGCYKHPTIPGHEFAGEVVELGSLAEGVSAGDRVAVVPLLPCMKCDYCLVGDYTICENYDFLGSRSDGAFAEYVRAKPANCVPIPEGVSFEAAAMVDPATVALHGLRRTGGIETGDDFLVFGAGPIGMFALQWGKILGAGRVFVVDLLEEKLALCKELGADVLIDALKTDPVEEVKKLTGGKGVPLVMESAGSVKAQLQSIEVARKLGTVINIGTSHKDITFTYKQYETIRRNQLTIVGSINYWFGPPHNEWATALHFMSTGQLKAEPMITHRCRLDEAPEIFPKLESRSIYFGKVLFLP